MKKKHKSNKPQAIKTAVVARKVGGESNARISRELGISRNTVQRILSEAELSSLVAKGKGDLYELIPQAVKRYAAKVRANPDEAKDFLERVTALPAKRSDVGGTGIRFSIGAIAEDSVAGANANSGSAKPN